MDIETTKQHVLRGVNSVKGAIPPERVAAIAEMVLSKQAANPAAYAYIAGRNAAVSAKRTADYQRRREEQRQATALVQQAARQRRLTGIRQLHEAVARLPPVTPVIAAGLDALLKSSITGIPGDVLAREQGVTLDNLYQRVLRAKRLVIPLVSEEGRELLLTWKR